MHAAILAGISPFWSATPSRDSKGGVAFLLGKNKLLIKVCIASKVRFRPIRSNAVSLLTPITFLAFNKISIQRPTYTVNKIEIVHTHSDDHDDDDDYDDAL